MNAFEIDPLIYAPEQITDVLRGMDLPLVGNNKGEYIYNIPCAFDIETTSFYMDNGRAVTYEEKCEKDLEKYSLMYVWQFGINGKVFIGRTWEAFTAMIHDIARELNLSKKRRLICYVHNLSFEFQFIRKYFTWENVFSIDVRKPIYARTVEGIEFRCSYLLSGYSLGKLSEHLTRYKTSKMIGDLDYHLIRHAETPLTDKELHYCIQDVVVVMCYIKEQIEDNKNLWRLPITKTGYVRKFCRKRCLFRKTAKGKTGRNYKYYNLMEQLQINGIHEFNMLQRAFAGGFTHANANYTGEVIHDVMSYDFTSSYPYVMVSEFFPMSKGRLVECNTPEKFKYYITNYCCIFDIELCGLYASQDSDTPISLSKCYIREKAVENNGRVVCAERVALTITDVDFKVIQNFYTWKQMRIGYMYVYTRGYLPTEFVSAILELYEKKTTLKGVTGKEVEYLQSKEMLNSCYGMCVTDPLRDEILYDEEWLVEPTNDNAKTELLAKHNNSKQRFLFYPWGVFVTAYARRNLFTAIYTMGNDYIYSDTDSVKVKNGERYEEYIRHYNNIVYNKLQRACKYHGISFDKCTPKTIKGINKTLGVWDYEGTYKRFKTLGAKRYMVEDERGDISITVSGVNKKCAVPYLLEKYGKQGIFEAFTNYLTIPVGHTGKNILSYIDYAQEGYITDYTGKTVHFSSKTGVHLEPTSYSLSLSVAYLNYLFNIKYRQ